jgi:hypothetical protein
VAGEVADVDERIAGWFAALLIPVWRKLRNTTAPSSAIGRAARSLALRKGR